MNTIAITTADANAIMMIARIATEAITTTTGVPKVVRCARWENVHGRTQIHGSTSSIPRSIHRRMETSFRSRFTGNLLAR
jgi:hypothetical protein